MKHRDTEIKQRMHGLSEKCGGNLCVCVVQLVKMVPRAGLTYHEGIVSSHGPLIAQPGCSPMPDVAARPPCDPIWTAMRAEAWSEDERDPILRKFLKETILSSRRLEEALSLHLSSKLGTEHV